MPSFMKTFRGSAQKRVNKNLNKGNMYLFFRNHIYFSINDKKISKNNIFKSVKNIPNVKITDINHFSAYDLAKFKKVIFTETSIKELEKRY